MDTDRDTTSSSRKSESSSRITTGTVAPHQQQQQQQFVGASSTPRLLSQVGSPISATNGIIAPSFPSANLANNNNMNHNNIAKTSLNTHIYSPANNNNVDNDFSSTTQPKLHYNQQHQLQQQ